MAKKKKAKIYDGLVPFRRDGSLVAGASPGSQYYYDFIDERCESFPITWKPNFIFDDGLAVISTRNTTYSNTIYLESVNDGLKYALLVRDLPDIFSLASIYQQEIGGVWRLVMACHWTFKSYYNSYFVTAIDPEKI